MKVSAKGGPPVLDKGEVTRMMETVWIVRAMERDRPESPEKARALAAIDVVEHLAKTYGAKYFNADGTLKEAESRTRLAKQEPTQEKPAP